MRCFYTLKTASSILSCVTHTHTQTFSLFHPRIHTVNTQILPCNHTCMHRHFPPLLSDCDLVSIHSSSLWLQSALLGLHRFTVKVCFSLSALCVYVCVLPNYCLLMNVSVWLLPVCWRTLVSTLCVCKNISICFVNLF